MAYSLDLRERVVESIKDGMRKTKASKLYKIPLQTIYNWLKLEKEQGHLTPKSGYQKGHSHGIKDLDGFRTYVDLHPDYTQEEMAKDYGIGSSSIGRALKKIGYSRKKRVKHTLKGKPNKETRIYQK
jgi:transposase